MSHSLDGFTPTSVENPETLEGLSNSLAKIHGASLSAVPWGGGTRIGVGNVPSGYDVAIDLSSFTGEIEHEPGDMTVIANAGVTIGRLNNVLAAEGQRLAFEVGNPANATVGGSVASNAPGHRQSSTGGIRDWVIGMQTVLADGTVTKSGGRVVKNVQGYEMHRLNTGAFGTLGVISQVAFKLLPLPAEQQTIIAWFDEHDTAREVGMRFVNGLFMPEAITLVSGPAANKVISASGESAPAERTYVLMARVGGGIRAVERQVNEVVGAMGAQGAIGYAVLSDDATAHAWNELDGVVYTAGLAVRFISRTSVALNAARDIESHPAIIDAGSVSSIADLGFGSSTITATPPDDETVLRVARTIREKLSEKPGSYVIEKCPLNVKQDMDVFSDVGSSIDLMRRIKAEYDPTNTLNPGRFAGKI